MTVTTKDNPATRTFRHPLSDGRSTTVHAAAFPRESTRLRIAVFSEAERLTEWCRRTGTHHAMTGGFFSRKTRKPLGRVWMDGLAIDSEPFGKSWTDQRGALHIDGSHLKIARLGRMPSTPRGDLLTAGPILVRNGRSVIVDGYHYEGLPETWQGEIDDEWTCIRTQRSAIGFDAGTVWAVAVDGPHTTAKGPDGDAGLTISELAGLMQSLGVGYALNLDGGGGTTLVRERRLVNRPRAGKHDEGFAEGDVMPAGRPIHTAIVFEDA
ncbi:MAG TPA: phosphodiester glycosidase family protein [Patescibacteria group bacterium]